MAIQYTRVFTFEGNEAENVRRGLGLVHEMASSLSMTELRKLVSKYAAGSYAKFVDLLRFEEAPISITEEHAETLIELANELCGQANSTDIRKLQTWLSALLADMKTVKELRNEESNIEQPRPVAHAS